MNLAFCLALTSFGPSADPSAPPETAMKAAADYSKAER